MTLAMNRYEQPLAYLQKVEEKIQAAVACESPEAAESIAHILGGQGKRLRPLLVKLSASFGSAALDKVTSVAAAAELIHTASLVHDDMIDEAPYRRGRTTAHQLWGTQSAVLLGDYLFACAFRLLVDSGQYNGVKWFSAAIADMCQSEIEQARCLFELEPEEDKYLKRISMKTASLIEACCRSGADLSGLEERDSLGLVDFGRHLGLAYQLTDDLLDFLSTATVAGKPVASDFRRGVVTLPVIYLMEQHPERQRIQDMLRQRAVSDEDWEKVREWVTASGALARAEKRAQRHIEEACRALARLPSVPERSQMESLCQHLLRRLH